SLSLHTPRSPLLPGPALVAGFARGRGPVTGGGGIPARAGRGFRFCLSFRRRVRIRLLIRRPAVVRLVEPGPLEDDRPAAAEEAFELVLLARRALRQRRLGERLQLVERVPAGLALVVVGRHELGGKVVRLWGGEA